MSTLLSELEGSPGPSSQDGDLVNQIMREMNAGGGGGGGGGMVLPPPTPAQMIPQNPGMINSPMPNTAMGNHIMDNNPATAHVIGGSQPTPADFAAAMQHGGSSFATAATQQLPPVPTAVYKPKKSWTKRLTEEFKTPLMVAFLIFVFSLPVVNFLFAHYLPSMVKSTGQLTTVGLLIKSLAAGSFFWLLQRVIVPLFSL